MDSDSVVLRKERSGMDSRYLGAKLNEDGDLIIEGQDLGPTVEAFWDAGNTEYEWAIVVHAANIPLFVAALGGAPGVDVLPLLASRFADDERYGSKTFLDEHDVPTEFWSRVGD